MFNAEIERAPTALPPREPHRPEASSGRHTLGVPLDGFELCRKGGSQEAASVSRIGSVASGERLDADLRPARLALYR